MEQVIIWGCGDNGKGAYKKLNYFTEILAFTDNNHDLWNGQINDIAILCPNDSIKCALERNAYIVIAIVKYQEVEEQLITNGFTKYLIWKGFQTFKHELGKALVPYSLNTLIPYKKKKETRFTVLYLQTQACIRTLKIAKAVSENGIEVLHAFLASAPEHNEYNSVFANVYPIESIYDFLRFLKNSEIDVIHSSNEPDYLSNLAQMSGIPVIHDCHDLRSAYLDLNTEELIEELLANQNSAGVIYYSDEVRKQVIEKFDLDESKTHVLENLISGELAPEYKLEKLSKKDGKIHIVYEGGVIGDDIKSHRYYEEIWEKIVSERVQLHFYSLGDVAYFKRLDQHNPNIHYEGNLSSRELASEMSKYDVGICILNVTDENREYLENSKPNKIQEYVNAGIPVAVGNIESHIKFVEENEFGKYLKLDENIELQLEEIKKIQIKDNILFEKGFTLESKIPRLIDFYQEMKKKYRDEHYYESQ